MKQHFAFLGIVCATLLGACGKQPTREDVTGTWRNSDGAQLTLEQDGRFFARSLPQAVFFRLDKKFDSTIDGHGVWTLKKGAAYWEVRLSFKEIATKPASYGISVLVSGSGPATYLYEWKGEEGQGFYRFDKIH